MEITVSGVQTWAEVAGLIVSLLLIVGSVIGTLGWLLRLEFQNQATKEAQATLAAEFKSLDSRVETKVDTLQNSVNTVLITMGEMRGELRMNNRAAP